MRPGYPPNSIGLPELRINLSTTLALAIALAPFVLSLVIFMAPGVSGIVKLAYPMIALLSGSLLYWRRPTLYVGFAWWVWLLTPGVRRLIDYHQGWDPQNVVMLAPFLVTSLTSFTLLKHSPKLQLARYAPFGLVLLGLLYGYAVGVLNVGPSAATFDLLNWLVPVLLAFYLTVNWRDYPGYRETVRRVFTWGALLLGGYGLIQYFSPPPWDRYWMLSAPIGSIGLPEPFGVRVFSTLNSSGPFAVVIMAALLLLLTGQGPTRWPAALVGLVGFLLSLVRSAWGGWILGALFIASRMGRPRLRLLGALAVTALVAVALLSFGPLADTVGSRLQSLTDLDEDTSLTQRLEFYADFAPQAFLTPLGDGMGSTGLATKLSTSGGDLGELGDFDSGIMTIPFVLGWPGTVLYAGGLALLLLPALRGGSSPDPFATASQGIVLAVLAQLVFDDFLVGVTGAVFWTFLGLSLASKSYHTALDTEDKETANTLARRSATSDFISRSKRIGGPA